ncbi:MAG: hypothetical protein ABWX67_00925 [Allosphingosinicella sp.]
MTPRSNSAAARAPLPPQLLTYATSSDPHPLAAGETGSVTLTAGLITTPVYCDTILITVKVGSDPDCLFQDTPTGSVVPASWSAEPAQMATGASLGLDDGEYATIKFYTDDPGACEIDYPFALTVAGTVGNGPGGVFPIHIQENSGATGTGLSKHAGTVGVESGTAPFYLANFVATAAGSPLLPCTEFTNGAPVTLSWESNGGRYALWRKGETAPFWTGVETTFCFTGPATDTTYFLIATSPDPDVTGPLYGALTLTISNPDLTPRSVTVAGKLRVKGATTLSGGASVASGLTVSSGGASITGDTTITGAATATALTVTSGGAAITGNASASGTLTVGGNTTLQGFVTVGNTLSAPGIVVTAQLDVLDNAEVNGNLTVKGAIYNGGGMLSRLATARGNLTATPPLSRHAEIHLSGTGRLSHGKAWIRLDPALAGAIAHGLRYRVLLTALDECRGLRLEEQRPGEFRVGELQGGKSNAAFDWLVIGRRAAEPGAAHALDIERLGRLDPEDMQGPEQG